MRVAQSIKSGIRLNADSLWKFSAEVGQGVAESNFCSLPRGNQAGKAVLLVQHGSCITLCNALLLL